MKNIFKITGSGFLILFIFLAFQKCKTNKDITVNSSNLDRIVYWFYINISEYEDHEIGYKTYKVQVSQNRLAHGSAQEYHTSLWKNMGSTNSTRMAIGPFYNQREADIAKNIFKKQENILTKEEENIFMKDTMLTAEDEVFWFPLEVVRRDRSNSFKLGRIPARIHSGNYQGFIEGIKVFLWQKKIPIGPFWSHDEAEESKRIYRLH